MANCRRGGESTGLLDYVSFGDGYNATIQRRPSKEEDLPLVELVTERHLLPPLHSVVVVVILAVTFLFALIYFAVPVGVHVCLQNKCYFSFITNNEGGDDSSNNTNTTVTSAVDGGVEEGLKAPPTPADSADGESSDDCDIPARSFPFVPVFPANYSIDTIGFCYGQNKSDTSQACTAVLTSIKEEMGYHNVSSIPFSKVILGLSGDILHTLQFGLQVLFNIVEIKWPSCLPHAEIAICQYLFPPVIDNDNLVLLVNHSTCVATRDNYCKEAWKEADKAISKFVAKCNKTYPILNMLHMPRCQQMPERSLMEAPNCVFSGVNTDFGKRCSYWQYNSANLSNVSLGLQDLFFIATWILAVALTFLGFILPWTISRRTSNVFPYFSMMVVSGISLVYALFLTVVYLSYSSPTAESALFCPSENSLAEIMDDKSSTGFCKTSVYLFQMIALSISAVWMYILIIATVRLTNPREPSPSTWLRSSLSVILALALGALALLPSIISALTGTNTIVFPRRPTVICVDEDEGREFVSFILPLAMLLLVGTVFIMYILYKTLVSLSTIRKKAALDRTFASLQFYPLKPQLRVLLFLLLVGILLTVMLALAVSSRLSALVFEFDILPFGGKKMKNVNLVPGGVLLVAVFIGAIPYITFLVALVVEWSVTAFKIK